MTASDYRTPAAPEGVRTPTPAAPQRRRSPVERRSTVLTVALWACVAYFVLPLVWLVVASTKDNT
ncbi:hypothetical protein PAJ60_08830, partial [Campylobacter jejuni]|nr:hypothetical protein [Campylobacter jejuni]